jgi:hypothetical protein
MLIRLVFIMLIAHWLSGHCPAPPADDTDAVNDLDLGVFRAVTMRFVCRPVALWAITTALDQALNVDGAIRAP